MASLTGTLTLATDITTTAPSNLYTLTVQANTDMKVTTGTGGAIIKFTVDSMTDTATRYATIPASTEILATPGYVVGDFYSSDAALVATDEILIFNATEEAVTP